MLDAVTGHEHFSAELSKTQTILFSPQDNYMVTYEPYVVYGSRLKEDGSMKKPEPNLRFWHLPDGALLATHIADIQVIMSRSFYVRLKM